MKDLAQIIKDNPGCIATIDNDWWELRKAKPVYWDELSEPMKGTWFDDETTILADSNDSFTHERELGYVQGQNYGGDFLIVLAKIQGLKLESV